MFCQANASRNIKRSEMLQQLNIITFSVVPRNATHTLTGVFAGIAQVFVDDSLKRCTQETCTNSTALWGPPPAVYGRCFYLEVHVWRYGNDRPVKCIVFEQ